MKESLDKIEKIIEQEIKAYSELEKYIDNKTQILSKNDIPALEEIDNKIIQKTTSAVNFARARQQECINVERIDLTFSELVKHAFNLDKKQGERFEEKRKKLASIIKNIQNKNNINAKLIDNSLFIMNKTVDFILKLVAPELDSYTQNGQMKKLNDNYKISSIEQEA